MEIRAAAIICVNAILLFTCVGCEGTPIVLDSERVPSPDSSLEAIVERVDNGLGFGQGAVYDEIHVQRAATAVLRHGNDSDSVVFYVMEETDTDVRATAFWTGARRLVITYDGRRNPGHFVHHLGNVAVDYSPVAHP